jgi:chaperone modulatory protein CbpM
MGDITLTGSILEELDDMTVAELAGICSCKVDWIVELVEEGVLEPRGRDHTEWRFTGICLLRTRTALRLYQDLNINVAGIALVIDLMDEVDELQGRLRVLDTQ